MAESVRTTRGAAKRGEPEEAEPEWPESPEGGAIAATPKKKAKTGKGTATATAKTSSSPPGRKSSGAPSSGMPPVPVHVVGNGTAPAYPSITVSMIRSLRWGDARDLMLPFLSEEEKSVIHKKTRADLQKVLEARIVKGDVKPERFWEVVGVEKASTVKAVKPMDPEVVEALRKNRVVISAPAAAAGAPPKGAGVGSSATAAAASARVAGASPAANNPTAPVAGMVPGMPPAGMFGYPLHAAMMPGTSPQGGAGPHPGMNLNPFASMPPRRPPPMLHKYTLRVPASIWPSTNYPPGIVIGELVPPPSPMAPPCISGTFHGSAILALGPGDEVFHPNNAKRQLQYIFAKLDLLLAQLGASHSDVLTMTAHVVDVHENGREVMDAHGRYMAGRGRGTRSICSWTMIGVSGLMTEGCVVQLEVKAIVRRGIVSNLILDRPAPPPAGAAPGPSLMV